MLGWKGRQKINLEAGTHNLFISLVVNSLPPSISNDSNPMQITCWITTCSSIYCLPSLRYTFNGRCQTERCLELDPVGSRPST